MWPLLQNYGLSKGRIVLIALLTGAGLALFYKFPSAHVDAVATIIGLGLAIPGLLLSIELVLAAKTASDAARDAAIATSTGLQSLEAYRRSSIAVGDLDRLKTSLIKRQWQESSTELASILRQLRSVMDGGLTLSLADEAGLAAAIKGFEVVETRLADAIFKDQEPQNASALFRSVVKHIGFLSAFAATLRTLTQKEDKDDGR